VVLGARAGFLACDHIEGLRVTDAFDSMYALAPRRGCFDRVQETEGSRAQPDGPNSLSFERWFQIHAVDSQGRMLLVRDGEKPPNGQILEGRGVRGE